MLTLRQTRYGSTLCRRQKHIDIAISYQKSSDGLHLLVDSTGLKFLGEG
ncbi:transposase, partial [Acinetobacter baumannii]